MSDLYDLEKSKYEKAWDHDAYRNYSPGEEMVFHFMDIARPLRGKKVIDFGAGTGRASLMLHDCGIEIQMVDIAENCLDDEVRFEIGDKLVIGSLWNELQVEHADVGYCTDVMEHIPTEKVHSVLKNISDKVDVAFFHVCFRKDHFGEQLDEHLHLTVKPFKWWLEVMKTYFHVWDARDLIDNGVFYGSSRANH